MRDIAICGKCERFERKKLLVRCAVEVSSGFVTYQEKFMDTSKFSRQVVFEKCLFYPGQIGFAGRNRSPATELKGESQN